MQLLFILAALMLSVAAKKTHHRLDLPTDADLRIGIKFRPETCERKTKNGDKLSMHYTGKLYKDGEQFDSSVGRGPFDFVIGSGQVIKGWEQGLLGMCIGEKRKLTIPSDLGYGKRGSPPHIPADATLVFDVELLDILNYIKGGAKEF